MIKLMSPLEHQQGAQRVSSVAGYIRTDIGIGPINKNGPILTNDIYYHLVADTNWVSSDHIIV